MKHKKKAKTPKDPISLHPNNKHQGAYDFKVLVQALPALAAFVRPNKYGVESINFSSAEAVILLNQALIKQHYGIEHWVLPTDYLCPPIPGRADYIHHIADLLATKNQGAIPTGKTVRCLDIGMGASAIYPILAQALHGWNCVGTDIDPVSIESAQKIAELNSTQTVFEIRLQPETDAIFKNIWQTDELFDLTLCNPPFHASQAAAAAGSFRKLRNLKKKKVEELSLNFGGQKSELCCEGGEKKFVGDMIAESKTFANQCFWFSSLVSREANLPSIYAALEEAKVFETKTLDMGQGNKKSRIVAWTFLNKTQQEAWAAKRWG